MENPFGYEPLAEQGERAIFSLRSTSGRSSISSRRLRWIISFTLATLILLAVILDFHPGVTTIFSSKPSTSQRLPLTLLLSAADANIGELDFWIHGILSRLGRPIDVQVVDNNNLMVVDDSIILTLGDLQKWTNLTVESGFQNVGLLRIGDEYGKDISGYEHFSYVFRPYWFDDIVNGRKDGTPVLWIPNGYSTGVGPRFSSALLTYDQRPQMCYFEGSLRDNGHMSSREKMRQALLKWDPKREMCDVRWTAGFMRGQSPLLYSSSLARTKYALCPAGNSPETIRFYEALENNAIPVVVDEHWLTASFGNDTKLPFIVLKSWDEVGPRLQELMVEDPAIGYARQRASRKWWDEIQEKTVRDATSLVDVSFHKNMAYFMN